MTDKYTKNIHEMIGTCPIDAEAYRTMAEALRRVADGPIDTGAAMGQGSDFWISIAGIEYFVSAKRSMKQRVNDGTEAPPPPLNT